MLLRFLGKTNLSFNPLPDYYYKCLVGYFFVCFNLRGKIEFKIVEIKIILVYQNNLEDMTALSETLRKLDVPY